MQLALRSKDCLPRGRAQTRAIGNARRHLQFNAARILNAPLSLTNATRLLDDLSHAPAARTGLGNLKESARADDLAASAAGGAIDRARAGIRTLAVALGARVELAELYLFLHPEGSFLEGDLHIVTQIGPALAPFAIGRRPAAKKSLENSAPSSSAEDFPENIERIMETSTASGTALSESGVPEAIVSRALIGIDQDVIGFAEFLKFFLRVRIVRIFVRMKFHGELAIGALHLFLGSATLHREDFVVIALFGRHLLEPNPC
jgi:hypothetical protein